jgi:hypothetical protein
MTITFDKRIQIMKTKLILMALLLTSLTVVLSGCESLDALAGAAASDTANTIEGRYGPGGQAIWQNGR